MKNQTIVLLYLLGFALLFISASQFFNTRARSHQTTVVNLSAKLYHIHGEISRNMRHTKNFLINNATNISPLSEEQSGDVELKKRSNRSIFALVDEILMDNELSEEIDQTKLSSLKEELNKHTKAFNRVAARLKEKRTTNSGVIGNVKKASDLLLSNKLIERAEVLDIRNSEKDFLLTHEERHLGLVKQKLSDIRDRLLKNTSGLSRTQAIGLLQNYEKEFDHLVRIGQEVGVGTNSGYHAQMLFWEDKLFSTVDELRYNVDKLSESNTATNEYAVLTLCIALIVSCFILSRLITSNLSTRAEIAQRNCDPVKPRQSKLKMSA